MSPSVSPFKCRCPLPSVLIIHTLLLGNFTSLLISTTITLWLSHLYLQSSVLAVVQWLTCLPLCDLMDCSTPGFPVLHYLLVFAQTHVHWDNDAIQPSLLCPPLLFWLSILLSSRVFSNESALRIRWSKYWSFSFSISPSNEYLGLIYMYTSNSWGRSPFKLAMSLKGKITPKKRLLTSPWLFVSFFRWL